ncbi:MAG: hypothetical protein A2Y25_11025 [Candidatus Melainabacteria bacterium GWF2_37_15]|nr:MAG: hypothetical protein A2Y25_11025 [Candidatus Melainabacteria bacterium GWF2_37_15]
MATSKDKLNKIIENLNEIELAEVIDFAQFINERRKKVFDEAFKTVKEESETLSEQEIKDLHESSSSKSISYTEMWGNNDL